MSLKGFTSNHPSVGRRVELPAFSDQWMRGAQYGVVRSVRTTDDGKMIYAVKCDHPQIRRLYRHYEENFTFR